MLIEVGTDPNRTANSDITSLMTATSNKFSSTVKAFMTAGAGIDACDMP